MADPKDRLHKLRAATEAEQASIAQRARRYKRLTAKIAAYQDGTGPAPTVMEFQQWREDVELDVALRKLLSDFPKE